MSRPKKGKSRWMDERALKKLETDVANKVIALDMAYHMDSFDYNKEQIIEYYKGMERYMNAISDHLVTLKQVCDIIEEYTGIRVEW